MRRRLALALCMALFLGAPQAARALVITYDVGGHIGDHVDKYEAVRDSGEYVMIDGVCASACTLVLGIVPNQRICVTPQARLGFHQAWNTGLALGTSGPAVADAETTAYMLSLYPAPVQYYIARHGGLPPPTAALLWLSGESLESMFRRCP